MAEKRTIDINIKNNADEATKDFNHFNDALDETAKSAKNVNSTFEEVYGELQPLTTRLGEAEDRLYELALAGDTTSKEYQELLTKVGQYRKVQIETDLVVDSAATTMGQKLGGALSGATSGFAAVQGVMALVGGESEALEKTLLKVQAALAIQQGVQGIREAIPAFKQLGKVAKTALTGIKSGIAATGIGLLVVALGTVVAYWDDISAAMGGAAAEGQRLLDQAIEQAENANQQYQDSLKYADILRAQGKTEEQILAIQDEKLKNSIALAEASVAQAKQNKQIAIESVKFNRQILQSLLAVMLAPLDALVATYNQIAEYVPGLSKMALVSQQTADLVFDVEDVAKESDAAIALAEKALEDLRLAEAQRELDRKKARRSRFAEEQREQAEQNKKLADLEKQRLQNLEDQQNAFLDRIAQIEEENYQRTLSDEERELRAVQDKYFELETLAEGNAEALNAIEIARLNEENEIKARYAEEAYNNQKALDDQADADQEARLARGLENEKIAAEAKQKLREAQIANVQAGIALFKDLAGENKKLQAIGIAAESAASIAKTIITTQAANAATTAQGTALAITTAGASVAAAAAAVTQNNISAGISIAAQIAAAAKGISALGGGASAPSGSAPSGGGAGGGEVISPEFNVVGDAGINQLAQLQQQPMQAFVVSGEVTSAQALDRNRVTNATL